ncbi:MAG: hypothetical protein PWR06_2025 [Thermoanaerobacteraceae bacterium]|nr:hypothetical protein [Thermoanaerobacteraceae bacterium]RKL64050.1 cupin domain-containing protein [Thermoanaerobacteraceae bacterium SP2]
MVASDGKNVEELKKSKIVKGHFSLIKKGDWREEQSKAGFLKMFLVENQRHGTKTLGVGKVILQPGEVIPEHRSPAEEVYVVLEGKGTLGVEGTEYAVEEGDVLYRKEDVWHGPHRNTGDKPFVLLTIVGPALKPCELGEMKFKD